MALDEGMGMVTPRRPRRRMTGPPDPIAEALAGRDRPQGRPDGGRFPPFASEKFQTFDDSDVSTPHQHSEHMDEMEDEGGGEEMARRLIAMLQSQDDWRQEEPGGEDEEYRPIDEMGEPWGMDTDPGDASVLRNLLAMRRQGLQQGRYR